MRGAGEAGCERKGLEVGVRETGGRNTARFESGGAAGAVANVSRMVGELLKRYNCGRGEKAGAPRTGLLWLDFEGQLTPKKEVEIRKRGSYKPDLIS